jgi:uncharacterized membrane protein
MTKIRHFQELDALRGFAVLLMVLYHTAFDLRFFYEWPIDVFSGGWWLLARTSAILFLLIAGICAAISWFRKSKRWWEKVLRRFLILAGAAAIVSFTTWLIAPQDFVKFGILHLFALATLLLPLFHPLKYWNALLGSLVILFSSYPLPPTPYALSIILGSPPPSFSSLDYFPLVPWFGVILIGTAIGHILYLGKHARIKKIFILNFVGRHALLVYLLHQPIILGERSISGATFW